MKVARLAGWVALATWTVACGGIVSVSNSQGEGRWADGGPGSAASGGQPSTGGSGASGGTGNPGSGGTGNPGSGGTGDFGSGGTGAGAGGSGGSGTCNPAFCPTSGVGMPCCMTPAGPCGIDQGNGCEGPPSTCNPPAQGAKCDQLSSGIPACDTCLHANCCDPLGACFAEADCVGLTQCSVQYGCFGQQNPTLFMCLQKNCGSYLGSFKLYSNAMLCGRTCCAGSCS